MKARVVRLIETSLLVFAVLSACGQTRTLRIVTYNIEADTDGFSTARSGLIAPYNGGGVVNGGVLEGIGEEVVGNDAAQPIDILACRRQRAITRPSRR